MILLPANLASLANLTGENTRFAMDGIMLRESETGYTAAATDGKVLAVVEGERVMSEGCYPKLPILSSCPNGATTALVPGKAWTKAFRKIPKGKTIKTAPILNTVACVMSETVTTLATTDGVNDSSIEQPTNIEGRFPAYEHIIPDMSKEQTVKLKVDPLLLAKLLEVASRFREEDSLSVEIEMIVPTNTPTVINPVVIKTRNGFNGQSFTGVIMPMA